MLIGGVGYRWQRDASIGLLASDELERHDWPPGIDVMDLGYGALYAAQDIGAAEPPYDRVIFLTGLERGRAPGRIYEKRWNEALPDEEEIQARVFEAGAGVIHLDHLLVIAKYFEALPDEVIVLEVEPVDATGGEGLSPEAEALLPELIEQARRAALAPLESQSKNTLAQQRRLPHG